MRWSSGDWMTQDLIEGHDEAFVRNALDHAAMNVLRMAIYQLTGDQELAEIPTIESPIRGGALSAFTIPPETHALVKEKALQWLRTGRGEGATPGLAEASKLMNMFAGQRLSPNELRFGYEELAFEPFPRDVNWTAGKPPENIENFKVLIVGAGISGIAAAVQLKRLGIPFQIVERNDNLGGTWWTNDYPDARVDTSSYLYQFKFEKNYPWSEFFAARDESLKYLNHIVDKHEVRDAMQFGVEVVAAEWSEEDSVWQVVTRDQAGEEKTRSANVLISASGLFNKPKRPDIDGIESFSGQICHTTEWNDAIDVSGKRTALIGTGSTGAQLAPIIAESVGFLGIYQRTPEWVMAFENYKVNIGPELRWLFDNIPYYWNWYCFSSHMTGQTMQGLQYHDREWQANGGIVSPRNDKLRTVLEEYIRDKVGTVPGLAERLTPDHAPLVRRLVVDNGFYDAIMRDNVELYSGGIRRITPAGIVGEDGVERDFDVIVLGTGFETAEYFWPASYRGRKGASLENLWAKDGARSYLGITIPGFPNFFVFYGPNGSPRSGGFYSWSEVWSRYICSAIVGMIEKGHNSIEVRRDVFDRYNEGMDEAMKNLIWEMGGASYYVNEHGRSGIFMPWETQDYHAMVERVNFDDFVLQ